MPRYYDGQLRWDLPVAGGTLTAQGFFSDDQIQIGEVGDFSQFFVRGSLRYQRRRGATTWSVTPWGGRNAIGIKAQADEVGTAPVRAARDPYGLRADVARDAAWGDVAGGLDVQGARVTGETPDVAPLIEGDGLGVTRTYRWYADVGLWTEARWRIADGKLTVKPAARVDYLGIADRWTFDPRLVVSHELAPWFTLRESLGVAHQPPGPLYLFADEIDPRYAVQAAVHTSIGAHVRWPGEVRTSVTWFDARFGGPGAPAATSDDDRASDERSAGTEGWYAIVASNLLGEELSPTTTQRGHSAGVEASLQKRTDRWMLWLAYTWSHAERHAGAVRLDGWVPYVLDQTHNLGATVSVALGGWQLGARARYVTGLPYTPVVGSRVGVDGEITPVLGATGGARLPAFVSLDLRVDRRWRHGWGTVSLFVDVQNATNRANPEGVGIDADGTRHYQRGLPVLPTFGVTYAPPGS
ncbi:MAG: TonB-dependent receptor [Kofleriaceae bacterium]|nr:TonB-dependent receptor [Kofleriaceae bacterium]